MLYKRVLLAAFMSSAAPTHAFNVMNRHASIRVLASANTPTKRSFFFGSTPFDSADDIFDALQNDQTTILDVRGPDEVAANGYFKTMTSDGSTPHAWVLMPISPFDGTLLEKTAPSLLRDKSAPILVHCASGKRSAKAKEVLDAMGYERVLNIGGWGEVQQIAQKL